MKLYLVGGAVRDRLLGRPGRERDWVVVGATPAEMRARGFAQVGRDFPVFLHPRTREQYALARTERSTGPGHADFECSASPEVSLDEDLARRDLTINAMAESQDGELIDPCGGRADLADRLLRHVSPAFREDPLRVFRVARFAAQLPDFRVHDDTLALLKDMAPDVAELPAERVWTELVKAAEARRLDRFFEVARAIGGTAWFEMLDLAATIRLHRERSFDEPNQALAALGWTNDRAALGRFLGKLRPERLARRAMLAVAEHGRVLTQAKPTAPRLLDALTAIGAFRQGALATLVVEAAARCAQVSPAPLSRLAAELREVRVEAAPGPAYGAALSAKRLEIIAAKLAERPGKA